MKMNLSYTTYVTLVAIHTSGNSDQSNLSQTSGRLGTHGPSDVRLWLLGTRGLPARYGGFETLASILKARLEKQKLSVCVSETPKIPSGRFFIALSGKIETFAETMKLARRTPKASRVVVFNPVNIFAAMKLRRNGNFVVMHMDGRDDRRRKWPIPIRCLYRLCQRICVWSRITLIFDSRTIRNEIGGRDFKKHTIIAYGGCEACESNLKTWQASGGTKRLMSLARAEPENQLVEIVRSVNAMAAPMPLRVVTTTRYRGRFWNSLVAEVNESRSAELIDGMWDKEQLCSMYREVSAVIHGHTVGGTNPSLVLALCHGTPVFAHDNQYNREVAGSLARYWKDEQELTKLLDEFDPATWPYDQAAVDDFNRRYNWDDVVEKYKRLLGLDQS